MTEAMPSDADRLREAVRRWDACKGADLMVWRDYLAEDVEFYSLAEGSERLAFTAGRRGWDQVHAYLEGLAEMFEMDFYRLDQTVSEGDRVVGIGATAWHGRATGKSFETPVVLVTRWRDGRIVEFAEYYDTAKVAGCAA